jgi:hypothetical protein
MKIIAASTIMNHVSLDIRSAAALAVENVESGAPHAAASGRTIAERTKRPRLIQRSL